MVLFVRRYFLLKEVILFYLSTLWYIGHAASSIELQKATAPECESGQHMCQPDDPSQTRCIPWYQRCDRTLDCEDGSDETNCSYRKCQKDDFRCEVRGLSVCLPKGKQCDGYYDCRNKRDEENCNSTLGVSCSLDQFRCANGQRCIDTPQRCNQRDDCGDKSDEDGCTTFNCPALKCEYRCLASKTGGTCWCPKGFKLSNKSQKCIDQNECTDSKVCDQLCHNTEGSYYCSCYPGYALLNVTSCAETNVPSFPLQIFFAHGRFVESMSVDGATRQVVAEGAEANGLDFHYARNLLFWSDTRNGKVYSQALSKTHREVPGGPVSPEISLPGPWTPSAIAVDWIGDKLYVVDSAGHKIDVFELDGRDEAHAIVVGSQLTSPKDIALDPTVGLMFILDTVHLVRASMDGVNVTIITDIARSASGVAVDIVSKSVFWCDQLVNYIETVDYNGKNRFFVFKKSFRVSPARLAIFEKRVYWTDNGKGIMSVNRYEVSNSIQSILRTPEDFREPKAIKIVHSLVQRRATNPCGSNNGGCAHMCLIKRNNVDGSLGFSCACYIGYQLESDLHSCNRPEDEFLLYSQKRYIKGQVLDPNVKQFTDVMLPVAPEIYGNGDFVASIDFNAANNQLFYSDLGRSVIYKINRNGTGREVVFDFNAGRGSVLGLAFDWVANNLYYTEVSKNTLSVLSTKNVNYRRTLLKNLNNPRAIVVHPNKGYIFFSGWEYEKPGTITRAHTDGTHVLVFKNVTLRYPSGLAIDFQTDRLYWCDSDLNLIQHSNLNGTDVRTINSDLSREPSAIVVHKDWMYIIDKKRLVILRLDKLGRNSEEIVLKTAEDNTYSEPHTVKVFSKLQQHVDPSHPCLRSNGGCQKLCFGTPTGENGALQRQCGCPDGEKLDPSFGYKQCMADPNAEPPASYCPDDGHNKYFTCNQRCLHKSRLCDGRSDCLDNFDEENCTNHECAWFQKKCADGTCVEEKSWCDGKNDCGDDSDETDCANFKCPSYHFKCDNGRCIIESEKCDTDNNCGDGSDEGDFCEEKTCKPYEFTCHLYGRCINNYFKCDFRNDCVDNEDEKECPPENCQASEFRCANARQCILKKDKCDGISDCKDGSDELGCPKCDSKTQFQCKSSGICILKPWYCDGAVDCDDSSDEPPSCKRIPL